MCRSGWSTTAAATTGPARQPRPTSSTPATYTKPTRRSAFSSVRVAGTRTNADLLCLLRHLVLHTRGLALQVPQVIQLRSPHPRRFGDLDLLNGRRVQGKNPFDTLAERDLADGERGARSAAVNPDHNAFENLNAFIVAFAHLDVHTDGVPRSHGRPIRQLRLLDQFDRSHRHPPAPRFNRRRFSSRKI